MAHGPWTHEIGCLFPPNGYESAPMHGKWAKKAPLCNDEGCKVTINIPDEKRKAIVSMFARSYPIQEKGLDVDQTSAALDHPPQNTSVSRVSSVQRIKRTTLRTTLRGWTWMCTRNFVNLLVNLGSTFHVPPPHTNQHEEWYASWADSCSGTGVQRGAEPLHGHDQVRMTSTIGEPSRPSTRSRSACMNSRVSNPAVTICRRWDVLMHGLFYY